MMDTLAEWAETYVGRPWIEGERECWHLVCDVRREVFNDHDLPLVLGATDPRECRRLMADHPARAGWRPIPDAEARAGDVAMMAKGRMPDHVGVHAGGGWILHAFRGADAVLTAPGRLADLGYRITGSYRRT